MRTVRLVRAGLLATTLGLGALLPAATLAEGGSPAAPRAAQEPEGLTLEQCLAEALRNNRQARISRLAVEAAEAQHRQALSGYWPQVGARAGYQRLSSSPDFVFKASQFSLPAGTALVTVPAGVLGPNPVQLPVSTPAQSITVPDQHVKLASPDNVMVSANATWLLFDGGMRAGYAEQAAGLVALMKEEARRSDLEVADSVTRLYWGAVLARGLARVAQEAEQKLTATADLTSAMYQGKTGKVTRMDWLDSRVMVGTVRGMLAELEKNQAMAEAALALTMGRPWSASVRPADAAIPFAATAARLDDLVDSALRQNPDWLKVQAGLRATTGALATARSEHFPKLALTGEAHRWWNWQDGGLVTDHNKLGWSLGIGVEIPIFSGFLTSGKVAEAERRLAKLLEEQRLLKDAIGLRLREATLELAAGEKAVAAARDGREAAAENCALAIRAYESGLIDTEKVIRAQISEALGTAQHLRALYEHAAAESRLRLLVGGPAATR